MDDFFSSIDVLLFPSQWKESFGLTVREAISRGVWVIVTDAGGIVEDCIEGVNSNIVPMDGDYVPLRDSIKAILDEGKAPVVQDRTVVSIGQQAHELNDILLRCRPMKSE
jgi:glycosyltransferase involved in cell wall biosynthesis